MYYIGLEKHTPVLIREKTIDKKLPYQMKVKQVHQCVDKEYEFYTGFEWKVGKVVRQDTLHPIKLTMIKYNVIGYSSDHHIDLTNGCLYLYKSDLYDFNQDNQFWKCPSYIERFEDTPMTAYTPNEDFRISFSNDIFQTVIFEEELTDVELTEFYRVDVPIVSEGILLRYADPWKNPQVMAVPC